jgi:hypothetical protein
VLDGACLLTSEAGEEIDMAQDSLGIKVTRLEEKVQNHITFFWAVAAFQFLCLGGLLTLSLLTRSTVNGIAKVEANVPAQIVASLLNNPAATTSEAQANLAAASSVLQASKIGTSKPDAAKLKAISDKLLNDQEQYPELPQVWKTTGVFINYKFQALLPSAVEVEANAAAKTCKFSATIPGTIKFENCNVNLEEVAAHYINVRSNGQHVPIEFVSCLVRYNGGGLPDTPMHFINSILTFNVNIVPPRNAISAMRQLAQADTVSDFTIKG